jgi:flagellar protein FlbD
MIPLTRLNKNSVVVNADQIMLVEATPDTLLVLSNGDRLHVRETVKEVIELALNYQRRVHAGVTPPLTTTDEAVSHDDSVDG